MRKQILSLLLILLIQSLYSQDFLKFSGKLKEQLSSEKHALKGRPFDFKFSPFSTNENPIFSFSCKYKKNRKLYIYHSAANRLTEITPVGKPIYSTRKSNKPMLSSDLHWNPVKNEDSEKQWFTFVNNGINNNHDIYIGYIIGDGYSSRNYIRLTEDTNIDNTPRWSPDGKSIAFISNRNGNRDIYILENIDKVMKSGNAGKAKLKQLTQTTASETDLHWNPNPESRLLAYAATTTFHDVKGVKASQIWVLNLNASDQNPLIITPFEPTEEDASLKNFTYPRWNTQDDTYLSYLGKAIGKRNAPVNLYVSQVNLNAYKILHSKRYPGYLQEIFSNIDLRGAPPIWLSRGYSILCQQKNAVEKHPFYIVNIQDWQTKFTRSVYSFKQLKRRYPRISGWAIKDNQFIFSAQKGKNFKIFSAILEGDDILPFAQPIFSLQLPEKSGGFSKKILLLTGTGVAAAAAAATIVIIAGKKEPKKEDIGSPPAMPKE